LLYAGTEFGFFVSFDNGRRWHSLQQNLPASPVTDIRVHRGDLVISTMGRSFWIMDDIAPLRQMAPAGGLTLLQPSARVRYRRAPAASRTSPPQYPAVALAIDYVVPAGFIQPLLLEITNADGRLVRRISSAVAVGGSPRAIAAGGDPQDSDASTDGERRAAATALPTKPGHNRFLWDYRWANGGPLVAPGTYTATLGGTSKTFEVVVDPAVLLEGTTAADLLEQQNFLLAVRDAQAEAIRLGTRIQDAMQKAGVRLPTSPGPGESVERVKYSHPLQALWARVVTGRGAYQQGMLIEQFSNISRAEGGADQKIGAESRRRLDDLLKRMKAIEAELRTIAGM
jgi:hypothetical protein